MIIGNYLSALNTERNYKINTNEKAKSTRKISTGLRIGIAADDAAGLTISEKMRAQIRGLDKGTKNAEDGISWVQIGDGALNEVHSILHRMTELTIQSLNDTNTEADRAALQAEFDELQSEIDKITNTTQFNTQNIFSSHEPVYHQMEGNIVWPQSATHTINSPQNTLTINFQKDDSSPIEQVTISVPDGVYTTQELIDEIDDALTTSGGAEKGLILEYTKDGTCNLNYEDGKNIDSISGTLAYLLNDIYEGGSMGALIGTTEFISETIELEISTGNNDNLSFQIQNFDGTTQTKNITIPSGQYTRNELIDILNNNLTGTSVTAVKYSTGIKLQSDSAVITGFKGNMFKIDVAPDDIYTSVFYDNVMYGKANMTAGTFTGGAVLPTDIRDTEHQNYAIDSSNNTLKVTANGEPEVTITIPEGTYSAASMAAKLNELFAANSVEINTTYYNNGSYEGLKMTSSKEGLSSKIQFDTTSSAYATLFTQRTYTKYLAGASTTYDSRANSVPVMTSGKKFDSNNLPLEITNGTNDAFTLNTNDTTYTITLTSGTYNTAQDIATEINNQLNGASASSGYKDKITASVSDGKITLKGNADSDLTTLTVSSATGNNGYKDLFVGEKVTYTTSSVSGSGTTTTPATITLNTPVNDPATIDDSNKTFKVNIDGTMNTVTLPTGSITHDQMIASINNQLQPVTTVSNNTFNAINVGGNTTYYSVNLNGSGNTSIASKTFSDTGYSEKNQGQAGAFLTNDPATVSIDKSLPATTTITNSNNEFSITVNGSKKMITLDSGNYTQEQLKNQLQTKLDNVYGKYYGGVVVGLNGGKLTFTSRLKNASGDAQDAKTTSLSVNTTDNSFLKELYTTRTAADAVSTIPLQSTINIDSSCNEFKFNYNDGNTNGTTTLILSDGSYTRSTLIDEINKQLTANGIDITASLSGDKLRMTTNGKGSGYSINYSNTTGGNSVNALFGTLKSETGTSATTSIPIQESITIDDSTNEFNIKVNNHTYNLTLDNGTYDRNSFLSMLRQKFTDASIPATVTLSGNKLVYTTTDVGSDARIYMTYNTGGSSMPPIYGTTTTIKHGATASFTSDGKLQLTSTENDVTMKVSSDTGGLFQTHTKNVSDINPSSSNGYISTTHAAIDGVNIGSPVTIDNWNKELKFTYKDAGVDNSVTISLEEKDYTYDELKTALQEKLDASVGSGKLSVTVDSSGVNIKTIGTGSLYRLYNFSGGFYDNVLCSSQEISTSVATSKTNGTQSVNQAFTVGRKDIRAGSTEIINNVNDSFEFDLTINGSAHTISVKLDEGVYNGTTLVNHLQDKINEKLVASGFKENIITAQIGGVNTGVIGSNDANALCLKLSNTVELPAEGTYIIDGVRGSAAFHIFYQSDGKMIPAYVKGSKDLSEGLEVTDENNTLSFDVDGTNYTITLDNGEYTQDELIEQINNKLTGIPVSAKIEDNYLKLMYKNYGEHSITNISGNAKDSLFFQENFGDGKPTDINLQLSGNAGNSNNGTDSKGHTVGRDYMTIERPVINTASLGINSVTISKPKYANKALTRLYSALDKVSSVRSTFGSIQNRLEHAIKGNDNTSENTSAAESRLRDADISEEMVAYSAQSILQQAGQAMIAQTTSNFENVLALLQ